MRYKKDYLIQQQYTQSRRYEPYIFERLVAEAKVQLAVSRRNLLSSRYGIQ